MFTEGMTAAIAQSPLLTVIVHVFFQDKYHGDHHFILAVDQKDGEGLTNAKEKALAKVDRLLDTKRADRTTLILQTQEEYEASHYSKQEPHYVVYQNGKRNFCRILAATPEEAKKIFHRRVIGITQSQAFTKQDFESMLTTGEWKKFPLELANSPN